MLTRVEIDGTTGESRQIPLTREELREHRAREARVSAQRRSSLREKERIAQLVRDEPNELVRLIAERIGMA